jgi:hypothetical protein
MTRTQFFPELGELPETASNMETAHAFPREVDDIHHRRVMRVYETEAREVLVKYTIRDFVDEETPHANWGSSRYALDTEGEEIDELINGLEFARME